MKNFYAAFRRISSLRLSRCTAFLALLMLGKTSQAQFNFCSFDPRIAYPNISRPIGICTDDLDGDGKPDLAVTNVQDSMNIYLNQSAGAAIAFSPALGLPVGSTPYDILTSDIDGDGKKDICVLNRGSSTISVFRNISTPGNISLAPRFDIATNNFPYGMSIGDVDGDGKPDLASTSASGTAIRVSRNTSSPGSISFAAPAIFTIGAGNPIAVLITDIDGDGRSDLAVTNNTNGGSTNGNLAILLNTGSPGTISLASPVFFNTEKFPVFMAGGDLDLDGKTDIAVVNNASTTLSVFRNTSTPGTASFAPAMVIAQNHDPQVVTISELDNDGHPDLTVTIANYGADHIAVFKNTSTPGSLNFSSPYPYFTGLVAYGTAIGDFNGDGYNDMATADIGNVLIPGSVSVFRNTPNNRPIVEAGDPATVCTGNAVALNGTVSGSATGGIWSDGGIGGTFSPDVYNLNATWTPPAAYCGTATFTLTSIGGSCGQASDTIEVTVINNPPIVEAGDPVTVCQGGPVELNGTVSGSATGGIWSDGGIGGTFSPNANTLNATWTPPAAYTGTATLTLTSTGGNCGQASDTKEVTVVNGTFSCSITSLPCGNTYTGGNPNILYLGYGPHSTTLRLTHTATGPVQYNWTGNGPLSCTSCQSPVFTPATPGTYTFTCTVTGSGGCFTTCSITICVVDIRVPGKPGKVYLCHRPPGNPNNPQQLVISVNAVPAHLSNHSGDKLGQCNASPCNASPARMITDAGTEPGALLATIYPNPSRDAFTCRITSPSTSPVYLRITDMTGRLVQQTRQVPAGTVFTTGEKLAPGVYMAELMQDGNRTLIKLVKAD